MNYITDISELDLSKEYTYGDYLTWRLRERIELIMGKVFRMSPAPNSEHQQIVSVLHGNIYQHLRGKSCRVFPSPFDVILPSLSGKLDSVVQPDISVICDLSRITEKGCMGPPDLVVEVVSKTSVNKDLHEKYTLYEQHGVKEYWLVLPAERSLIIFALDDLGAYQAAKPLTYGDKAASRVLPGFSIDLDEIFPSLAGEPEEGYGMEYNRI